MSLPEMERVVMCEYHAIDKGMLYRCEACGHTVIIFTYAPDSGIAPSGRCENCQIHTSIHDHNGTAHVFVLVGGAIGYLLRPAKRIWANSDPDWLCTCTGGPCSPEEHALRHARYDEQGNRLKNPDGSWFWGT